MHTNATCTKGKISKESSSHVGMDPKKDRNKAGMERLNNTKLLGNNGSLLSSLQCNAVTSLVHFVACKVN